MVAEKSTPSYACKQAHSVICIADDEDAIRNILEEALADEGFTVASFDDGCKVVQFMADTRPSLLLLDVMMPSMSGPQVVEHVRSMPTGKDVPVVLLSANTDLPALTRLLNVAAGVAKPFDLDALIQLIRRLLEPRTLLLPAL